MTKKKFKADTIQCETMITSTSPFFIGGTVKTERCEKKTAIIITEKKTGSSLGACKECLKEFKRINNGELSLYSVKENKNKEKKK